MRCGILFAVLFSSSLLGATNAQAEEGNSSKTGENKHPEDSVEDWTECVINAAFLGEETVLSDEAQAALLALANETYTINMSTLDAQLLDELWMLYDAAAPPDTKDGARRLAAEAQ